ncbi:MAG: n-acetylglutamate synthase [Lentisphaeria bacterium]|nr:n-acetylglutamate synthase [Lentisphaeria bacterium]
MTEVNLNGKKFRSMSNSANGDVDETTVFHYYQDNKIIWADYKGASIQKGHLIGVINSNGDLKFSYHHINQNGEIMIGECFSRYSTNENGKIIYNEAWQWLHYDQTSGHSKIIED